MRLRARVLTPFIAAMLLLLVVVTLGVRHTSEVMIQETLEQNVEHAHQAFSEATEAVTEHLEGLIFPITINSDFIRAMQAQDRERLQQLALPYLEKWRPLSGVTHFYFHTPDGHNFLRVHMPDRHGDLITRDSMKQAMKSGKIGVATETGLTGDWVHRVVMPWRVDGKLIGYVELGVDMEHIYAVSAREIMTTSLVLLEKEHIPSREIWEQRRTLLGLSPYGWDTLPDHVVSAAAGEPIDADVIRSLPLHQALDGWHLNLGNRGMVAHIHPVTNERNDVIGAEILLMDTSAIKASVMESGQYLAIAVAILLPLIIWILFGFLGRIQRKVETEDARLQAQVAKKTQELREYQSHLEEKIWERTADLIRAQSVAHIGSWTLDTAQNVLKWSDETYRIFGVAREEGLTLEKFIACVHPDDRERVLAAWGEALKGAPYDIEHRILLGGEVRWVRERAEVEFGADGAPVQAIGTVQDVTDLMQSREAQQASEQRLNDIASASADWMWEVDAQGRYTYVSDGVEAILGYRADELLGKTPFDFMPPEEAARVGALFADIVAARRAFRDLENLYLRKDGVVRHVWTYGKPILGPQGELLGFRGVDRDVTERVEERAELERYRHQLEEMVAQRTLELTAARESTFQLNRMLHTVLDTIPVRIFWKDDHLRYLGCNQLFAQDAGRESPSQLIGQDDYAMGWSKVADLYRADDRRVIETGESHLNYEEPQTHADGRTTWLRTSKIPLRDETGRIFGVLGTYEDITAEKKTEQTLRESRDASEAANRAKSTFLANMSHEIRTPLNGILGLAQIGVRDSADARARQLFGQVMDSGQLLLGIINDLLDFSKIEAGKLEVENIPVQLAHLVRHITIMCGDRASAKGLPLHIHIDEALPPWFKGDPLRIAQVLVNLLGNAIKFTDHGEVSLTLGQEHGRLVFSVRDTGIGMSPGQVAQLFQPFEQADGTITRRFGGTGLGLAISKRLVDLMDGEITVESAPGAGSTFKLYLPLIATSAPEHDAHSLSLGQSTPSQRLDGLNILAAEDNPVNRMVLEDMLRVSGASLVCVEDGQQALDVITREGEAAFDIVLTDIHMPVMDGHTLAQRLKQLAPTLPVVGVTAHAMVEEQQKCRESGMVAHVAKPVAMEELFSVVSAHARRRPPPPSEPAPAPATGASPEAATPTAAVREIAEYIDWSALQAQYPGRHAFIVKLLNTLVQSHAETPAKLRAAAATGDMRVTAFVAHSFAGVAGAVHAMPLRLQGKAVEAQAKANDPAALTAAEQYASAIEQFIACLRDYLAKQA